MGFLKWLFTGKKEDRKKQVSMGLGYELKRIFGLIETIDEKEAKLKTLNAEKKILSSMIDDYQSVESKVLSDEKRFKAQIKKIETILLNIKDYESKLKRLDESMDKLSSDIRSRTKQSEDDILELKKTAMMFKEIEDKVEEEKKKVKEQLEEIKEKVKKEESRKAAGYSAVLVGPVNLEQVEKAKSAGKFKKIIKEEPVININVEVKEPEKQAKEAKKLGAKKSEAKERVVKSKAVKTIIKKKIIKEEPKKDELSSRAEEISDSVVDEALNEGVETVEEVKPYYEHKTKVETEIDKVLALVKQKGKVSFAKLAKMFEEKSSTIEQWAEALEEQGFIEIVYPLIGSPYMKLKK